MSRWEQVHYGYFTIALEPWGDGNYNAHLTDREHNNYDHGMVASYLPRDKAIKDAQLTADAIAADPDAYADLETTIRKQAEVLP